MKLASIPLSLVLIAALPLASTSCIYVRVTGDLDEEWDDGEDEVGFHELQAAVEGCLVDPEYDLGVSTSPWHTEADWTVSFVPAGSDEHSAFRNAREAVLARITREGGTLKEQHEEGPHAWSCSFTVDGEPGEASVRLADSDGADGGRSRQLEVNWEEAD